MSYEVKALTISTVVFDSIFPFHIAFDSQLKVRHAGSVLKRIYPQLANGCLLLDLFSIKSPVRTSTFAEIAEKRSSLFVLTSIHTKLMLRGQMVFSRQEDLLVYLCTPWLADPAATKEIGISISDFALHDSIVDLLHVLQAQATAVKDLKLLTKRLEQKGAALAQAHEQLGKQFAELESAQALAKTILDTAPDGIITANSQGIIEVANQTAERLFGYSAGDLAGKPLNMLMTSPDSEKHDGYIANYLQTRSTKVIGAGREVVGIRQDGTLVPLYLSVGESSAGGQLRFTGILHDISERKTAEQALRESENRYRSVVDSISEVVFQVDRHGRVTFLNQAWCEVTGFSIEESLQTSFLNNLHPDDQTANRQILGRLLDGSMDHVRIEARHLTKSGEFRWVEIFARPILDSKGRIRGTSGTLTDIHARRATEIALQRAKEVAEAANLAKGDFVANVSHEIRTPMNAVIGMTGLLLDTPLTGEQREYVETIRSSGENLLTIINDILDFSKIESSMLELEEVKFDLRSCIEEAIELVVPAALEKNLEIGYVVDRRLPKTVIADITRIRQVLVNLLSNAVKFTSSGEVQVTVSPGKQIRNKLELCFAVRDTGIGIAGDRLERLFQPFIQADSSITRHYGGTGLGLTISKQLAELMGGTLWVESEPGQGSTFYFTLQTKAEDAAIGDLAAPSPAAGRRLLVVEDSMMSRKTLRGHAENLGMAIACAGSADEACAALARGEFDALLLSTSIAAGDQGKLVDALNNGTGKRPLVALLGAPGARDSMLEAEFQIAGWLTKPVKANHFDRLFDDLFSGVTSAGISKAPPKLAVTKPDRSVRILVAEDNPINQKVALKLVESLGYRADMAGNGLEALAALKRQPYDIVLMDVQMPDMDGLEASRRIRALKPQKVGPYIIAMTANAMQGDREICLHAGMDDYIAKPIRIANLRTAIDNWREKYPRQPEADTAVQGKPVAVAQSEQVTELKRLGGDQLVAELMAEFHRQVKSELDDIEAAGRAANFEELSRLAHRLKGSSTTVGLQGVTNFCTEIEHAAKDKNERRIKDLIGELRNEVYRSKALQSETPVLSKPTRIMIADDHPVIRYGVRRLLQARGEYVVVGEASNGKEAIQEIRELQPDILLLDLNMPLLPGLDTLRELTTIQVPTRTVLLTSVISQREVLEALQLGARGIVLKDELTTDISNCISTIMKGGYWIRRKPVQNLLPVLSELMEETEPAPKNTFGLTARELEITDLIARGKSTKEIAEQCKISEETVKRHVKHTFDKVGVSSRLELALFAIHHQLVTEIPRVPDSE